MANIGTRIRSVRIGAGQTQEEFSKNLRISQSHLSGIEKGHCKPSSAVILLISILFDVNEDWLING